MNFITSTSNVCLFKFTCRIQNQYGKSIGFLNFLLVNKLDACVQPEIFSRLLSRPASRTLGYCWEKNDSFPSCLCWGLYSSFIQIKGKQIILNQECRVQPFQGYATNVFLEISVPRPTFCWLVNLRPLTVINETLSQNLVIFHRFQVSI